jgi:hypothetical protein
MGKVKKTVIIKNCNYKAQAYCFKKGFVIYPIPSNTKYKVWYSRGGNGQYYMKGKEFNLQEAYQSIWDLYTKIYNYDKKHTNTL